MLETNTAVVDPVNPSGEASSPPAIEPSQSEIKARVRALVDGMSPGWKDLVQRARMRRTNTGPGL